MFALIMAGGSGTRLWPASRKKSPKQLLKFIGNKTLLQHSYDRLRKSFSNAEIFVATTKDYVGQVRRQLPQLPLSHYSVEPVLRDRGPAIGLAALLMQHRDPKAVFVTAWSDHYIKNTAAYHASLTQAKKYIQKNPNAFIAIGVVPTFPHPGVRYIQLGGKVSSSGTKPIYKVQNFKDKPGLEQAERFLKQKGFLWNTGYFVVTAARFLEFYKKYLPEVYEQLLKIKPFLGGKHEQQAIDKIYPRMPKTDFEHRLIEHPEELLALPAQFDWADVGSWKIIKDVLSGEEEHLIEGPGNVITLAAEKNLIYNYEKKLIATIGLSDIVVVNTKDALLIANKNSSEQVKELVNKMKENKKLKKYL